MSTRVGVEPETEEVLQPPSNSEGGQEQKAEAPKKKTMPKKGN